MADESYAQNVTAKILSYNLQVYMWCAFVVGPVCGGSSVFSSIAEVSPLGISVSGHRVRFNVSQRIIVF
jgi:hypothetical protein